MLLKKAGIVAVGAAAGMVALSGAAFAGDAPTSGGHDHGHSRGHDKDRDQGDRCGASARGGNQLNSGDQLVGVNNTNVQAPINQLGVLSKYLNADGSDSSCASAKGGNQVNTGDQLVGLNNTNAQLPINQLGLLSKYANL